MARRFALMDKLLELESRITPTTTATFLNGKLTIIGDDGNNNITVVRESDSIVVRDGANIIPIANPPASRFDIQCIEVFGGKGNDVIDLGGIALGSISNDLFLSGNNVENPIFIDGGEGNDTLTAANGIDSTLLGGDGEDVVNGGSGNDTINGGDGTDTLLGGRGDDRIEGGNGDDLIGGGPGNDTLIGGDGKDSLFGNDGDNKVNGEIGDTVLDAGAGTNSLVTIGHTNNASNVVTITSNIETNTATVSDGIDSTAVTAKNAEIDNKTQQLAAAFAEFATANEITFFETAAITTAIDASNQLSNFAGIPLVGLVIFGSTFKLDPAQSQLVQTTTNLSLLGFSSATIEAGDGDDQFNVQPVNMPVHIQGGGGKNELKVNTDGLPATQGSSLVQIDNRADITFQDILNVVLNTAPLQAPAPSTLVQNTDTILRGEKVYVTYTVTNTLTTPIEVAPRFFSNFPILRVTSDTPSTVEDVSFLVLPDDLNQSDRQFVRQVFLDDPLAPGDSVTFVVAVLGDRTGVMNVDARNRVFSDGVAEFDDGQRVTAQIVANEFERTALVNKNPATGNSGGGEANTLVKSDDSGHQSLFVSDSKLLDPDAKYIDQPSTDQHLYIGEPLLASVGPDGVTSSDSHIFEPSFSSDGRFVVYRSDARNLVPGLPGPLNFNSQIWWRDLALQQNRLISFDATGTDGGTNISSRPSVSDDGRFVTFLSRASNLVAGFVDKNGSFANDLYLRDTATGKTVLVSRDSANPLNGASAAINNPQLSADGRIVIFESTAKNLVSGVTITTGTHLYAYDRVTDTLRILNVAPDGVTPGNASIGANTARISRDSSTIVFESGATNLITGFVNGNGFSNDVFAYDTATSKNSLVSGISATATANGQARKPSLSADGRFVAFYSPATDLLPQSTNNQLHVFVRDRLTGELELIDIGFDNNTQGNGNSTTFDAPELSTDGRFVAFRSESTNLVPGYIDGNTDATDLYIRDRLTGLTTLVNSPDGNTSSNVGHLNNQRFSLNAVGDMIVFQSSASNLIASDTNLFDDIYTSQAHVSFSFTAPAATDITLRRTGANFEFINSKTSQVLATRDAAATFNIALNGLDGAFHLDYSSGGFFLPGGIDIDALGNSQMNIVGGVFNRIDADARGKDNGFIAFDDLTLHYDGLNLITDTAATLTRTLTTTGADDVITISVVGSQTQFSDPAHITTWQFNDPIITLALDTGAGNDSVNLVGLPAVYDSTVNAIVFGNAGNDTLDATSAGRRVFLDGGAGNDMLTGGTGNDVLADGPGNDVLIGGPGNDIYRLSALGTDSVSDASGSDTLDFSFSDRPVTLAIHQGSQQTISEFNDKLTISGQIENFTGSPLNDSITVTLLAVPRTITGGPHVIGSKGDLMVVDALGNAATDLGGKVQVTGFADINHDTVETVQLINTGGAAVSSVIVNDGATQRSRLTHVVVNFSSPIDAAALGAITFTRTLPTFGTVVNTSNGLIVSPLTGTVSSITLTFANVVNSGVQNGSLADGYWQLAIPGANFTSPLNDTMLRRFFGDFDGNGTVDSSDFAQFGSVFGVTVADSPFDFDDDGVIGSIDFAQFGSRFGVTL